MTELCITVSKPKDSRATLQRWEEPSHRTPPHEIICTNVRHQRRGRDKHQSQRKGIGSQLPGTSVEDVSLSKTTANVFGHYGSIPVTPEGLLGGSGKNQSAVLGLSRNPTWSPVKWFELTQLGSAKQLARGTIQATGAWTETFQHTNENQELQQMVLKKVD